MRAAYSPTAVQNANHENPTQNTARQARCSAMKGSTRNQSIRSGSPSPAGAALVSNQSRAARRARRQAAGAGEAASDMARMFESRR